MSVQKRPSAGRRAGEVIVWLVLPLALGILLSLLVPRPVVGMIYLDDVIYSETARSIIAQIAYARLRPEVRAIVLVVDSPGGTVIDTESVYQELERLRQTRPVVATIETMAASGAYYLTVGTDYIYAKPTSMVGSIGVVGNLPPAPMIFEAVVATGPYKQWGMPADTALRQMEMIKQGFYQAVKLGRGDALRVGPEVLLRGEVWAGNEALRMGLLDELGSRSQAIERAARMARIDHYRVADLRDLAGLPRIEKFAFLQIPQGTIALYPNEPGLYLLYMPPRDRRLP
jgi:protease-4